MKILAKSERDEGTHEGIHKETNGATCKRDACGTRKGSKEFTKQSLNTNMSGNSFETQGVRRNAINRRDRRNARRKF